MRIDARAGDQGWAVWHVPECRQVRFAVWADDETAQYGAWDSHEQFIGACREFIAGRLAFAVRIGWSAAMGRPLHPDPPVHQAKRITISHGARLILIDPIDDLEPERVDEQIRLTSPQTAGVGTPSSHWCRPNRSAAVSSLSGARLARPGLRVRAAFSQHQEPPDTMNRATTPPRTPFLDHDWHRRGIAP